MAARHGLSFFREDFQNGSSIMSVADRSRTGLALSPRSWSSFSRSTLVLAAIKAAAVAWQLRWGTVPDMSWIRTIVARTSVGDRLASPVAGEGQR
jgi:hypothetical protein